jgi:hypothetical protein
MLLLSRHCSSLVVADRVRPGPDAALEPCGRGIRLAAVAFPRRPGRSFHGSVPLAWAGPRRPELRRRRRTDQQIQQLGQCLGLALVIGDALPQGADRGPPSSPTVRALPPRTAAGRPDRSTPSPNGRLGGEVVERARRHRAIPWPSEAVHAAAPLSLRGVRRGRPSPRDRCSRPTPAGVGRINVWRTAGKCAEGLYHILNKVLYTHRDWLSLLAPALFHQRPVRLNGVAMTASGSRYRARRSTTASALSDGQRPRSQPDDAV